MRPVTRSLTGIANDVAVPLDLYQSPFNVSIQVTVMGNITYSVQWTVDDVFATGYDPAAGNWFAAAANLTAATTSQAGSIVSPVTAVRLITTAGTGTAAMRVAQAGAVG